MRYFLKSNDPELDGLEIDVTLGDKLRAEREMTARGWGKMLDQQMTFLTLAIWRAALRAGLDVPDDFDTFATALDDFGRIEGDDAAPFPPAAGTDT